MLVQGAVGVVTGGASGLGEGVIRMLAARGGRGIIFDLPSSKGADLVAELGPDTVRFVPVDITDPAQVTAATEAAGEAFGRVDLLVSCAGISSAKRMLKRDGEVHPLEHFRAHVDVNLVGLFDVVRNIVPVMARNEPSDEGERGLIVNLASIAGIEGQVGQMSYAASKGGVIGLTLPLARDLASWGIRVMTICPGTMHTPMLATLSDEMIEGLAEQNVFPKRLGAPADLAGLVAHFMENTFLNGDVVRLDAALRMSPR